MRVQFMPSATDIQINDTALIKLIGGEEKLDEFLEAYQPHLLTLLQRDIETRNDLIIGDYGGTIMLEDSYGDYPFAIFLQMRKLRKLSDLVQVTIERLDFYSAEQGRAVALELTKEHGKDDMVHLK